MCDREDDGGQKAMNRPKRLAAERAKVKKN